MIEVLMPALSPTMEEGNLIKWHVKEGQDVKEGDLIAEIETDKAVMDFEIPFEGTVKSLLIEEGSINVKVNQPILNLFKKDEKKASKINNKRSKISPFAKKLAIENNINYEKIEGTGPNQRIIHKDISLFLKNTKQNKVSKNNSEKEILTKSNFRKTIFEKMEHISKTIPHFFLRKTIDVENLMKLNCF